MLLEMLLLHKLEEAVCHRFCCALAQGHVMGRRLVAVIGLFQFQSQLRHALCSIAGGLASIVWPFGFVTGIFGVLRRSVTDIFGVFWRNVRGR